jgi:endoglucanase
MNRDVTLRLLTFTVLAVLTLSCSNDEDNVNIEKIEKEEIPAQPEEEVVEEQVGGGIRALTAKEFVADMKPGWNFGNSFDVANSDKTAWGNPLPTTAVVDAVFERGFRTLRLPVTWAYNMGNSPSFTIEPSYFDRIEIIVKHALAKGMYVIINIHHDDKWIIPAEANANATNLQLDKVWTQIANRFKDYSDYLIFELLNEPRHVETPEEWTGGTEAGRRVLNTFNKTALNAIRETGGNNAKRKIMVAPYAAAVTSTAWRGFEVPNNDKDVIISLHAYFPFRFALEASDSTWGTNQDKQQVDALMNRIEANFIAKGLPVVMGEWGSIKLVAPASERLKHGDYFVEACLSKGIVPVVWDDGGNFGLLNRRTFGWDFPKIADAAADN